MKKTLICYGEVLWDLLPSGKVAGGAPMNVAFHANNLGLPTVMISRVGNDDLGHDLKAFLQEKNLSIEGIQTDPSFPTGTVEVNLDAADGPSYKINSPAAWDHIEVDAGMIDLARGADAVVFGSLACRNPQSQQTLYTLLENSLLRVLDVNLRPPYYSVPLLEFLLGQADIVKVNEEELLFLTQTLSKHSPNQRRMEWLAKRFKLSSVLLTKGKKGSVCMDQNGFFFHDIFPVEVKDTVGSGDAFLAGYLKEMMALSTPNECLEYASATGALVAGQSGGTPLISPSDVESFLAMQKLVQSPENKSK